MADQLPEWLRTRYQDGTIKFYSAGYYGVYDGAGQFIRFYKQGDLENPIPASDIKDPTIIAEMHKARQIAEPELVHNPTARLLLDNDTPTWMTFGWGRAYLDLKPKADAPHVTSDLSAVNVQPFGLTIPAANAGDESLYVTMPDNRFREFYSEHPHIAEINFINIMRKELGQTWDWRLGIEAAKARGIDISDPKLTHLIPLVSRFVSPETAKADRDYHSSPLYRAFEAELEGRISGDLKGARTVTSDPEILGKVAVMLESVKAQYTAYQSYSKDKPMSFDEFKLTISAAGRAITFDCNGGIGCIVTYDKTTGTWTKNESYGKFYDNAYNNLHSGPWQLVEMMNNIQVRMARTDEYAQGHSINNGVLTTESHLLPSQEALKLVGFMAPHLTASYVGLQALPPIVRSTVDPALLTEEVRQGGAWLKELREAAISAGIVPASVRERPAAAATDKATDGPDRAPGYIKPPDQSLQELRR